MGEEVKVTVTLDRGPGGRMRVRTDVDGLVPDGADVETAFMSLGSGMIRMLGPAGSSPAPKRFARPVRASVPSARGES